MPPTCPAMDVESVFKLWEGVGVLSGHRHCKAKSYSYTTETPFDRCLKQQVTRAVAQGTLLSVGHHLQDQEGFLPPPGLLPASPCLRATFPFPRHSFSSILNPSGAVWRFVAVHQLNTHPAGLILMAFFLHARYSPKLELAEHLHLRNTIIFPPSSWAWRKWSRDTTTFPDRKYLAHIPHAMSILNQSHSYFCAISFCSSFCFPTIYSTHI